MQKHHKGYLQKITKGVYLYDSDFVNLEEVLEVYEKHNINGHIVWKK